MRRFATILFFCAFQTVFYVPRLQAQSGTDSSFAKPFAHHNVLEVFPGVNYTKFKFTSSFNSRSHFNLEADNGAYMGFYLNYKWLSLKYSLAVPRTRLDNQYNFKYNNLQFRFNTKQISVHPFYESYNGLLYRTRRRKRIFDAYRNIQYRDLGADITYFLNGKTFSYKAANFFSEQQIRSAGSLFVRAQPQWQRMVWRSSSAVPVRDSATYYLLTQNPHWFSLIGNLGYNYNIAIQKGKFNIAPAFQSGYGILKELNVGRNSYRPVYNFQGWINAGYNGPIVYAYFNSEWSLLKTDLPLRYMNKLSSQMSVTLGYRFGDFQKKILGIL